MYKSVAILLVCAFAVAQAVSIPKTAPKNAKELDDEVRTGMRNAFQRGLDKFGNGGVVEEVEKVAPKVEKLKPHVFSQYTKDIVAAGGGKPAITDQYRVHDFVPEAPSVVAPEHKVVSDKLTPEDAAKIYVPHPPLQYSQDRLY